MSNYCKGCLFRSENVKRTASGIDFVRIPDRPMVTNKKGFCCLGYTQNPSTKEANMNAKRAGAQPCSVNPHLRTV